MCANNAVYDSDEDDTACIECGSRRDPACMLLCDGDGCDAAFHTYCLAPPLEAVPSNDWFCPRCTEAGKELPDGDALAGGGTRTLGQCPRNELCTRGCRHVGRWCAAHSPHSLLPLQPTQMGCPPVPCVPVFSNSTAPADSVCRGLCSRLPKPAVEPKPAAPDGMGCQRNPCCNRGYRHPGRCTGPRVSLADRPTEEEAEVLVAAVVPNSCGGGSGADSPGASHSDANGAGASDGGARDSRSSNSPCKSRDGGASDGDASGVGALDAGASRSAGGGNGKAAVGDGIMGGCTSPSPSPTNV